MSLSSRGAAGAAGAMAGVVLVLGIAFAGTALAGGAADFGMRAEPVADGVYAIVTPSTFASNLRAWLAMLDQLQGLDPVAVSPGHGDLTGRAGLQRLHQLSAAFD